MAHHHEVWIDTTQNRLYTRAKGFFTAAEVEKTIKPILEELGKVKPGFDVISDVSELSVGTPKAIEVMHRIFDIYVQKKFGRIVFVMGESLARMQITRVAKEKGINLEIANSIEEAERMLDEPQ